MDTLCSAEVRRVFRPAVAKLILESVITHGYVKHPVLTTGWNRSILQVARDTLATQYLNALPVETRHVVQLSRFPGTQWVSCLLYTSPSPRDGLLSRMPSSA